MIKINLNQIALGNRKTIVRIVGIADEIILMKKMDKTVLSKISVPELHD